MPTIFTKKLRLDEETAIQKFLYLAIPLHALLPIMKGKSAYPLIEEVFVVCGEYVYGDVGKWVLAFTASGEKKSGTVRLEAKLAIIFHSHLWWAVKEQILE